MTGNQILIFAILIGMLLNFIWGKWRYDLIALITLIVATILNLVPVDMAFSGFGHPAVITVATVLVVSKGMMNSGIVDVIAKNMNKAGDQVIKQLIFMMVAVTISSAFMNNIGALAIMMPVAIRLARKNNQSPSIFLMPLAFGSLLGGLVTLVGTPPNIIISSYRGNALNVEPFRMFDFAPVGAMVALVGVLFIMIIGWRLIPERKGGRSREELFEINDYITELHIPDTSEMVGKTIQDLVSVTEEDVIVVSLIRKGKTFPAPSPYRIFESGDTVIVEAATDTIKKMMDEGGLELTESEKFDEKVLSSEEIVVSEAIIMNHSNMIGRTARSLNLRTRFGINLLGVAREGARIHKPPDTVRLKSGDIILIQGVAETISETINQLGCLPLAERGLNIGKPRRLLLSMGIFATSLIVSAIGLLPVQVAFMSAAVWMVLTKLITLKEAYESIDWPIIVLLGSIIPVSQALETTGGAMVIADGILMIALSAPLWLTLMLVIVFTMLLSNIVNNAAAALIMAPIAVEIGVGMGGSIDMFLMSVAIGASCAFLTPIGHQSNTLVMGPGGYHFNDYWKLGLPLSILVAVVATPMILWIWQ